MIAIILLLLLGKSLIKLKSVIKQTLARCIKYLLKYSLDFILFLPDTLSSRNHPTSFSNEKEDFYTRNSHFFVVVSWHFLFWPALRDLFLASGLFFLVFCSSRSGKCCLRQHHHGQQHLMPQREKKVMYIC